MAIMIESNIEWDTASPLWGTLLQDPNTIGRILQPALLRFQTDSFMEDLNNLLQTDPPDPQKFQDLVAKAESFRAPPTGQGPDWQAPPPEHLKLYQPIHGFYYLVAASLVCHVPGLPDRIVNTAQGEKVSFVLRRVEKDAQGNQVEMAWINDPNQGKSWQPLTSTQLMQVAQYEELLPMFPLNFTLNGRKRRLLVGLVPTSSRDSFQATPVTPGTPDLSPFDLNADTRMDEVSSSVIEPIRNFMFFYTGNIPSTQAEETSEFILLDFAVFLSTKIPALWQVIYDPTLPAPTDVGSDLYNMLKTSKVDTTVGTTWQQALHEAWDNRVTIAEGESSGTPTLSYNLKNTDINVGTKQNADPSQVPLTLQGAIQKALPPFVPPSPTTLPAVPKLISDLNTRYVLRCVYQRPHCGPLQPDVVSNPTDQFVLAPFFDFDAPVRPIRITMPVDTSIAGLRKFRKNVAVLVSDKLRQQMECASGNAQYVLNGKLSCNQPIDFGTICSFSIPIITICALVVLLIFLILLNIVFWWLPFFRICFPIKK